MPLAINGYHVFQLKCSVKDYEEDIGFTELENDLSDSYNAEVLFGSNTGNRRFRLTLPTLTSSELTVETVTGINGETLSKKDYLWDLFSETKIAGTPFVIQSSVNEQYYLVKFADKRLSYKRFFAQLFSTGVELKQYRREGQTVFSPEVTPNIWNYSNGNDGLVFVSWPSRTGANSFQASGDVVDGVAGPNTNFILRLNGTTDDGILEIAAGTVIREAWLVMKVRAATFADYQGVLTGPTSTPALVGQTGGATKFFDFGFGTGFEYRLNDVPYAENNQQAPMNEWGIVHIRRNVGWDWSAGLQIGQDRDFASREALIDLAAVVLSEPLQPKNVQREIFEALVVAWGPVS